MASDLPDYTSAVSNPTVYQETVQPPQNAITVFGITPPSGTQALAFCQKTTDAVVASLVKIGGHTSRADYFNFPPGVPINARLISFPVAFDPTLDPQLDISLSRPNLAGACNVLIFAILDTESVLISPAIQGQQPAAESMSVVLASDQSVLNENLAEVGGAPVSLGQKPDADSVPVVLGADQQGRLMGSANQPPVGFDTLVLPSTQAAAHELIPGIPGTTIRLYALTLWVDAPAVAGSNMQLLDAPSGNPLAGVFRGEFSVSQAAPGGMPFYGARLITGNSLYVFQGGTAPAVTVRGYVTYSQD